MSDGEIPIKVVNVVALISLLKGHKFTVSQVCHHFNLIINNIGLVDSFSVVSFLWEGNWNAQKYMTSSKWLQNVMQPPIFGCTERYDPHPIPFAPTQPL